LGIISKRGMKGHQNYNSFSPGDFITLHQEAHYPDLKLIRDMCINGETERIEQLGKMTLREMYRIKFDMRDGSLLKKRKENTTNLKKNVHARKVCVLIDVVAAKEDKNVIEPVPAKDYVTTTKSNLYKFKLKYKTTSTLKISSLLKRNIR
jgi:hypothetical protein